MTLQIMSKIKLSFIVVQYLKDEIHEMIFYVFLIYVECGLCWLTNSKSLTFYSF